MVNVFIVEGADIQEDTWDEFSEAKCREYVSMPDDWTAQEKSHGTYTTVQLTEDCEGDCITFIAITTEI